jgi:epoxyqueuosine reductase
VSETSSRPRPRAQSRPFDQLRVRLHERRRRLGIAVFSPLVPIIYRQQWLSRIPALPWRAGTPAPWPEWSAVTPENLKTLPGIQRDQQEMQSSFDEHPLYSFHALHPEARKVQAAANGVQWAYQLPTASRVLRAKQKEKEVSAPERQPAGPPPDLDPQALTDELSAEARRLGISQVGFARYDRRYVLHGRGGRTPTGMSEESVIVCVLEQGWKATQTIPSARAEREVKLTVAELAIRSAELVEFLQAKGFQAQVYGTTAPMIIHHFAVEAGMGQLGLNGQVLTPFAGSRCRMAVITTNAKLAYGEPVDYGVNAICDECQLCVRRCPPAAIPIRRQFHRGIWKAKIKTDRCLPAVAHAQGCAVCMKVCPVQRYGLQAVTEHLEKTGEILGKGTDELEGYTWIDGRHYGPGERPPFSREFMAPGKELDLTRKEPPSADRDRNSSAPREETQTLAPGM